MCHNLQNSTLSCPDSHYFRIFAFWNASLWLLWFLWLMALWKRSILFDFGLHFRISLTVGGKVCGFLVFPCHLTISKRLIIFGLFAVLQFSLFALCQYDINNWFICQGGGEGNKWKPAILWHLIFNLIALREKIFNAR